MQRVTRKILILVQSILQYKGDYNFSRKMWFLEYTKYDYGGPQEAEMNTSAVGIPRRSLNYL